MVMCLRWVLCSGVLSGLMFGSLMGSVSYAAKTNSPTGVVHRLIAVVSGGESVDAASPRAQARRDKAATAGLAHVLFDIPRVSQRMLGKHWDNRSPAEQQAFMTLFEKLLARLAFSKSAAFFQTLDLAVIDEHISGQKAVVNTTVKHPKEGQIAVDYLLGQDDGTWRVHDIKLDGVSLATNFRLQFNKVIAQHSYAELLRRLQAKLRHYLAQTTH